MPPQKAGVRVAGWRLQLRLDREGARIRPQRLNCCHLRCVDVALATEVPGVAGGARGRHGAGSAAFGQTAVTFEGKASCLVRLRDRKLGHIRSGKPYRLG